MKVEPTLLVVSDGEAPSALVAALEAQGVFVERVGPTAFGDVLPVVAPDLVVAVGAVHALPLLEVLRATDRATRARLAVVAEPEAQSALRQLDRELLVTILSSEVPTAHLATRLGTISRRLAERAAAERASSRPPAVVTRTPAVQARAPGAPAPPGAAKAAAPGAPRLKGLLSLSSGNTGRRGTLSSDKLKAVPLPDLSLPQRADASKWRRTGRAHRVVLADDDVTRGAAIAQALIARGLEVQVVPLDPARTRWAQLQAHNPEVLIVDEAGHTDHRQVWLELFSADRVLRTARVIKVNLRSVFDEATLTVSLKALEKHIDGLAAWRHEMPTIIDDEERPTLVGGEEGGSHPRPSSPGFDGDFDDRPTMARAPVADDKPAAPAPSYGPPSVQLNDSIIAESKGFLGDTPPPLPTHGSHPPRAIPSQPTPASWRPTTPAPALSSSPPPVPEPPGLTPVSVASPLDAPSAVLPPAAVVPPAVPAAVVPPAVPAAAVSPASISPSLPPVVAHEPAARSNSWPQLDAVPVASIRPSSRPPPVMKTSPSSWPTIGKATSPSLPIPSRDRAPGLEFGPPPRKRTGLIVGLLALLGVGGAGLWLYESGALGRLAPASQATAASESASDVPATEAPTAGAAASSAPGDDAAPDPAAAPAGGLWTLGPGDALPCEQVVEPPAELTALTLAAGSRAWDKARNLLVLGDMVGAQRQMCTAVLNHPQSLALEGLTALYLTLRTPGQALRWIEQALGVRPDRPKTLELYGDVLIMLGREEEAKKAWLKGLGMPADSDKAVPLLARNLTDEADKTLRSGDVPRAEQLARRAAGLDMTSARAAGNLAAVLLVAGQRPLAERWTARCMSLDAAEPSCLLAQGDLALADGDLKTARVHYEKVTRLAPGDRRAWQKLGGSTPRGGAEQAEAEVAAEPAAPAVDTADAILE